MRCDYCNVFTRLGDAQRGLCRMAVSAEFCTGGSNEPMNRSIFLSVSLEIRSTFRVLTFLFNIVKPEISRDSIWQVFLIFDEAGIQVLIFFRSPSCSDLDDPAV